MVTGTSPAGPQWVPLLVTVTEDDRLLPFHVDLLLRLGNDFR